MKNNTTQHLNSSVEQSLRAARYIFKNERLIDLMINGQVLEFSKLRKQYPSISRNELIKISILNTCVKLHNTQSEMICLAAIRHTKATPQSDWLKLHRSFIFDLKNHGASLREISRAVHYRFHYKISHVSISEFLKEEIEHAL
jgi:hypothetical protein